MADTLMPKVGKYLFRSEPFHCDFSKHLLMAHLGNHLLNAADFHSRDRGFGVSYLNTIQRTWVLSRLAVEMIEMPQIYDEFYVETWCEKPYIISQAVISPLRVKTEPFSVMARVYGP